MYDGQGDLIQWKRLWQLISGIHYETPESLVKTKLLDVSKQLQDGLGQYKKNNQQAEENLKKLLKDEKQEKLLKFTQKLQEFLELDALQTWDILCFYLVNEYKGSASSLTNYISTESAMLKLLNDIWNYYTLERMVMLRIVKTLLEYQYSDTHPLAEQYHAVLQKIGIKKLLKSYIDQFDKLANQEAERILIGDYFNSTSKLTAVAERKVREMIIILEIITVCIDSVGIDVVDVKRLLEIFRNHSFGRQQQYLSTDHGYHPALLQNLTYHEIAVMIRALDVQESCDDAWVKDLVKQVGGLIKILYQFPEHGPLLLSWMIVNFQLKETLANDDLTNKYRALGAKAVQLKVFEYFYELLKHNSFKGNDSRFAVIVRKTIYNQLSALCELFDADSVSHHNMLFDLLAELLSTESITNEFIQTEEAPIRTLYDNVIEHFPISFVSLSKIAFAIINSGTVGANFIKATLQELPIFTEIYQPSKNYPIRASLEQDTFILTADYSALADVGFNIPKGTEVQELDKRSLTFVYFRHPVNYFTVLQHEINQLLVETLRYVDIAPDRLQRVTEGLKLLAAVIKQIQNPQEMSGPIVYPTEMVFDILIKFKSLQSPPIDLMSNCLQVCTALVPLFEDEIVTRVVNLGILPSVKNTSLDFTAYANGFSFTTGLVGNILINYERSIGRYTFLEAYLEFLRVHARLRKNKVHSVELPGLIFLLKEVFPHLNSWKFESEHDKQQINILVLKHFFEILQSAQGKEEGWKLLGQVTICSLLNLENGMTLLKFVAIGNSILQRIMENESSWMMAASSGVNYIVQLSMTILMHILRLKCLIIPDTATLSPLESTIYTQPKQVDTLRIIPVVTSYMNNIFNPRLPNLACRLLRRFALEFQMSLLACLDMEPDQIRLIFLQPLRDEIENQQLKIAILEFIEACIQKQPGLTEAFFRVSYCDEKRFMEKKKTNKKVASQDDGVIEYMSEYLDTVGKDGSQIASPLLSRVMSLFHSLWKYNMQTLVADLFEKPTFWKSLCNPLFNGRIESELRAYSQLFNIIGVEVFRSNVSGKLDPNLLKIIEEFLKLDNVKRWTRNVFALPIDTSTLLDDTPEWLCRLQSFKDLLVLILRNKLLKISDATKKLLIDSCLNTLIERTDFIEDLRPLFILAELYLIILNGYKSKYTDDDREDKKLLGQIQKLLTFLSSFYKDVHPRAKDAMLAASIRVIDFLSDVIPKETTTTVNIISSVIDIVSTEIYDTELQALQDIKNKTEPVESKYLSIQLAVNLLKGIAVNCSSSGMPTWGACFTEQKLFNRIISCLGTILPSYARRKTTAELLDLLIVLAAGPYSRELLFCDIGEYLWLKLLPPKELLQRPYQTENDSKGKWQSQDWWLIYLKGIQFVTTLLEVHGHFFKQEAIFFVGVHEEFLMDSLILVRQSLEPNAIDLIKTALGFVSELVKYQQFWRLEHQQSLANIMRCIQILMESSVSLLYRPKTLKRLADGPGDNMDEYLDAAILDSTDEIVAVMNELIEIITVCARCLLAFSPQLLNLVCDPEFLPSQWFSLIEIQFGAPKMITSDTHPQLSFGTVMSAASIFTKSLNLQHYTFQETPINYLPNENDITESDGLNTTVSDASGSRLDTTTTPAKASLTPGSTRASSPKTPFSKSMSMTSVTSYGAASGIAPSNEFLSHLDTKLCVVALETTLTLLASQSLLALKDMHLSPREKQLIRRELSTELHIFYDFVKKKIINRERRESSFHRKKYGIYPITNDGDDVEEAPQPKPIVKSSEHAKSLRVNLVKKLHQRQASSSSSPKFLDTSNPFSQISRPLQESTPLRGILKSAQQKRGADEDEEPIFFEPFDPVYTGLSYVKLVEEDYLHLLSNLFSIVCNSDN